MRRLSSKIQLGKFLFDYVCEVEVQSSYETLTDTCTIKVPQRLHWRTQKLVAGSTPLLKKGDKVKVELGYNERYNTVFEGYITGIKPDKPITILCEDAMWLLKQKVVTKSYAKVSLSTLLMDISPLPFEAARVNLGKFRISKATVAQVLDTLRKDYGLRAFVQNGVLKVGFPFIPDVARQVGQRLFSFQENIISHDLIYQKEDDIKIRVNGISIMPNNKKEKVQAGDTEGELRTIHKYAMSKADLQKFCEAEVKRLKFEGYRGKFTTFGEPFTKVTDYIRLQDSEFPERAGDYMVKSMTYKFGQGGYRQEIEPSLKVS